jgi:hypothetical protein
MNVQHVKQARTVLFNLNRLKSVSVAPIVHQVLQYARRARSATTVKQVVQVRPLALLVASQLWVNHSAHSVLKAITAEKHLLPQQFVMKVLTVQKVRINVANVLLVIPVLREPTHQLFVQQAPIQKQGQGRVVLVYLVTTALKVPQHRLCVQVGPILQGDYLNVQYALQAFTALSKRPNNLNVSEVLTLL